MQIRFIWPENGAGITLNEQQSEAWLDIDRGEFAQTGASNSLHFSLRGAQPYMTLCGTDYVCLAGQESFMPDQPYPLRYGLTIQAGRYALQVAMAQNTNAAWLVDSTDAWAVREVDALLARSVNYVDWQRPEATQADDDILKILESEYKRFLAWGEQRRDASSSPPPSRIRLKDTTADFAQLREQMKGKTLTECILGSSALMNQALEALAGLEADPGLFDTPRYDILKMVSPDARHIKETTRLPALTVREFHQPDLDSLL
ncbi:TagK domain-containing protein [Cronobacter malonaticus]|uniref:TagK domain-containing protein n=1 Tax=Cronobacter malonaticus TaxID=413503 RepID=UPI000CFE0675|nr:TagK domain-containing protein [Cronobacter malonaticus]ELY5852335.1 TagK domain-containing protein [Cronobacter malonaticus]WRU13355.1 TagK domain-containing protein [Cronobacter malonaticus]